MMLVTSRAHSLLPRFTRLRVRSARSVSPAYSLPRYSTATPATTMMIKPTERLVVLGIPLSETDIWHLQPHFAHIAHFPNAKEADAAALGAADVLYGNLARIKAFDGISNVKFAQLSNAGADDVLANKFWHEDERARKVEMATAAGVHIASISQYFIMTTLAMFHNLKQQILIGHNEHRWAADHEIGGRLFVEELRGKTIGILGYGHIGRECARISAAFGARVIAANSEGKKKPQEGYIEPHTGDPDGSIPEEWYSTRDPDAFANFLARIDVLLLALPSTPGTRHILNAGTLAWLQRSALVVNVGRGDAIDTQALLIALDVGQLAGAVLDVADPEPLPDGHRLFGRRDVLITPHLSGRTVEYYDRAVKIFAANLERRKAGKTLWNRVDVERGY